jgi:hypothetical protein
MRKSQAAHDLGVNSKKGNPSGQHWQIDVSKSVFPRGDDDVASTAFLPTPGKDRAQPHKKINECDH